ncbi:DNA-binding response regulator [Leptospira ognonensis]|uniref:DNA-binding response regulator n=1 Tax=Leptospira ognonensis TaxID=2484945 RepID=A0A4R9K563_9LEPT|nr:response regulator transcription factor [Leptospira ognonensis]TGL61313.1 DNA-binding response regulator [Leptospira ognonensis]
MKSKQICIIEDQDYFKELVREKLQYDPNLILTFLSSAEDFIKNGLKINYDLVYLDINLHSMNGLELMKYTSSRGLNIKYVILSTVFSDNIVFESLENGAIGYLLKSEASDLLDITHTFLNGGSVITPTIAFLVQKKFKKNQVDGYERLTERERQILEEVIKGYTADEVAKFFGLSTHTVRTQIRSIYVKLNVNNRTMLMKKLNHH